MPKGIYKRNSSFGRIISKRFKGKTLEENGHKLNCNCSFCKAKRGETKGISKSLGFGLKISGINNGMNKPGIREKHKKLMQSLEIIEKTKNIGNKNGMWQGGTGNVPYPFAFDNKLKELIRKRDNYTCQKCGKTQEENGRKLDVHHIDYIKENIDPQNLISLCRKCNPQVNGNRKFWIKFFKSKTSIIELEG